MSEVRAAVCPAYGEPEVVEVRAWPPPPPGDGQVRVRVHAAAVNFPDVLLAAGKYQVQVPPPFVPGSEFAGEVVELGPGATGVAVGDRVSGTALYGAFAQELVIGADKLVALPAGTEYARAAAFGVAHRTAYHALRSVGRVQAGETVIVLGAGGGVGLAAVQSATALGAEVVAVASSAEKLAVAREYGAAQVVNHRETDLRSALKSVLAHGADVVLDPVGGDLSEPTLRALRPGGRFVTVGYAAGTIPRIPLNLVLVKGISILGFQFQHLPAAEFERNEAEIADLLARDTLRPHIGSVYPLERAAEALREVADGRAVGKVVIEMG